MQHLLRTLVDHLPDGRGLDEERTRGAHRALTVLLVLHLPALTVVGLAWDRAPGYIALALLPTALLAVLGFALRARTPAAVATAMGLVVAGVTIGVFTEQATAALLHTALALGVVALYHDWAPYLAAVGAGLAGHTILALAAPDGSPAAVPAPALFLLLVAAVQVLWWVQNERAQGESRRYWRQLHEGERALVAELREAERVRNELVAVVGHEFRTPLASIIGYAQTIERRFEQIDPQTMVTFLRTIDRQAHRLEKVVTNVLASNGGLPSRPEEIADLDVVAQQVVAGLTRDSRAGPGRDIVVDIARGLAVHMSAHSAAQVLENLLDNALKFSQPQTEVRVSARRFGPSAVLEVADMGSPISEIDLERIFDPFFQADSSDTRPADGIGLGLHTVRRIVELHGGSVEARNVAPWVVFTVTLPAAVSGDTPPMPLTIGGRVRAR